MSQNDDKLFELILTNDHVFTKDLRTWINHRSRISDLRPRFAEKGYLVKSDRFPNEAGKMIWGYKKVALFKKETQGQLFQQVNHDGVSKEVAV